MGRSHDTVEDIRKERGWTTDDLAERTGYSATQTNGFCNGSATPTPEFLASLFEHTGDLRIPRLVTGRRLVEFQVVEPITMRSLSEPETLNALLDQRREAIEAETALLDLLQDGVDPNDPGEKARLEAYEQQFHESVAIQFRVLRAVKDLFEQRRNGCRNGHTNGARVRHTDGS